MVRPRRPDQTTIDPELLSRGDVGASTAHYDAYFQTDDPGALEVIFGRAVARLRQPDRACVTMVSMHGMTYDDAAELLHPELGRRVHRKTIWRWTQRGLAKLRQELLGSSWAAILLADRIPSPGAVPPADPNNESDEDIKHLEGTRHAEDQEDVPGEG